MSHNGKSVDQHIRLYVHQGLRQAEIALCLSVKRNIQISTRLLRRRRAQLKLHRRSRFNDAVILTGQICAIVNHTLAFDHVMRAHLINHPVITCDNT